MAMSDATLARKTNELKESLEFTVSFVEKFLNGEQMKKFKEEVDKVIKSKEYNDISTATQGLKYYYSLVSDKDLKRLIDMTYLAGVADSFLSVLEQHKIEPTEAIICKMLECASYQKWQEIKGEAWGKNNTNRM